MDFATNSEIFLRIAKLLGISSIALSVILVVKIAVLNLVFMKRKQRANALKKKWQPILIDTLDQVPEKLSKLNKRDVMGFLILWNYLQESIRDDSKENLNLVARKLNLDLWAIRALDKRNFRNKLLAIQTLGWLREKMVWDELVEIMHNGAPVISLAAARALIRIDQESIAKSFIELIVTRNDWSFSVIGKILREAGADTISEPMVKVALVTPDSGLPQLLRFFELIHPRIASPTIRKLLNTSTDREVIISCLRAIQDPKDLNKVRELLKHEDWKIRAQAAKSLGRLGTVHDEKRLAHATGDQEWWVRYRAAQALANLPSITIARLKEISECHYNPYATDVIDKVIGEQQVIY